VARGVPIPALGVVVPEEALAVAEMRVLPYRDPSSVVREQEVMRLVVDGVGVAQVLAHMLSEGHGAARNLEVVQLATSLKARVKVSVLGLRIVVNRATVEGLDEAADDIDGQHVEHEDAVLSVLVLHGVPAPRLVPQERVRAQRPLLDVCARRRSSLLSTVSSTT